MSHSIADAAVTDEKRAVGLLLLDEDPVIGAPKGHLADPNKFAWTSISRTVKGAHLHPVLSADPALAGPYIRAAQSLERDGASTIISNCGYTIIYQDAVQRNVGIPIAMSSLLLLPMLRALCSADEQIGILTFDAVKLSRAHLEAAWPSYNDNAVVKVGMENTESWRDVCERGYYDWARLEADASRLLATLFETNRCVRYVIVECCALCAFLPTFQRIAPVPVFDIASLANLLIGGMIAAPNHSDVSLQLST